VNNVLLTFFPHLLCCCIVVNCRPHILAPNKPATGNVVVDRLTAPLDKLRDSAGGREV
jgi:hypothetical protein